MDPNAIAPFHFRTTIEIINSHTNQNVCLLVPNPYQNAHIQFWANPTTQQVNLTVEGKPLTETMQRQFMELLGSTKLEMMLGIHKEVTDPMGKMADGIMAGHKAIDQHYRIEQNADKMRLFQKNDASGKFNSVATVHSNYRTNGPALTQPNPDSLHQPGTKKYRPITQRLTPNQYRTLRQVGEEFQALNGTLAKGVNKVAGRIGGVADVAEGAKYVVDGQYDKATGKAGEYVGGKAGAWAGAQVGARIGLALPIPHPIAKAVVAGVLGVGFGIAGAFGGAETAKNGSEKLYKVISEKVSGLFESDPSTTTPDRPDSRPTAGEELIEAKPLFIEVRPSDKQ